MPDSAGCASSPVPMTCKSCTITGCRVVCKADFDDRGHDLRKGNRKEQRRAWDYIMSQRNMDVTSAK